MGVITEKADDTTSDLGTVFEHFKELAFIAGETELSTEDITQSITHTHTTDSCVGYSTRLFQQ